MMADGSIGAKDEFRQMTEPEVRAALANFQTANPVSLEVGRLMVAFVERFRGSSHEGLSTELVRSLPQVRAPIEAVALHYAIKIMGDPGLLAVLQSVIPELRQMDDGGN